MGRPKIILTKDEVRADLKWLEVPSYLGWKPKAKALYEDNPSKYNFASLGRFFQKNERVVARAVDPIRNPSFPASKVRRKISRKKWYDKKKLDDPKFMAKCAAAHKRHRARERNNKKLGWPSGHWEGLSY